MPRRTSIKGAEAPSGETAEELLARLNERYRKEKDPNHQDTDPEYELFKMMVDQSKLPGERQNAAVALAKFTKAPLKPIEGGGGQKAQSITINFQPIDG